MVDMQFATFDEEELRKRIMELEYNAANNAMSMHAIIDMLDINNETHGFSDDMYKTAHNLAYKLRDGIVELKAENNHLLERVDDLDADWKGARLAADSLKMHIAALKELIDRLIDAGNDIVEEYWSDALNLDEIKKIELWLTLVNNWKESDK
jgi:cell division septum initiation protein DivIVA